MRVEWRIQFEAKLGAVYFIQKKYSNIDIRHTQRIGSLLHNILKQNIILLFSSSKFYDKFWLLDIVMILNKCFASMLLIKLTSGCFLQNILTLDTPHLQLLTRLEGVNRKYAAMFTELKTHFYQFYPKTSVFTVLVVLR